MIKSIIGRVHDTSFGGYPYKLMVTVELDAKVFNSVCKPSGHGRRDLGNLVSNVNNELYQATGFPAYNPSVDSAKRSKNGIKTIEFTYYFRDHDLAEKLGFEVIRLKNGECIPGFGQSIILSQYLTKLKIV